MKKQRGFTLVEMIITAVILAVISIFAIILYSSFITESRKNVAENVAASAANILNTAVNLDQTIPGPQIATTLHEHQRWSIELPSGHTTTFVCPKNMQVNINPTTKSVQAILNGNISSEWYKYDN